MDTATNLFSLVKSPSDASSFGKLTARIFHVPPFYLFFCFDINVIKHKHAHSTLQCVLRMDYDYSKQWFGLYWWVFIRGFLRSNCLFWKQFSKASELAFDLFSLQLWQVTMKLRQQVRDHNCFTFVRHVSEIKGLQRPTVLKCAN